MNASNWFYLSGRDSRGPHSNGDLQQWIREGRLSRDTMVWREGMNDWMPARNVAELQSSPGQSPLPPPPPTYPGVIESGEPGLEVPRPIRFTKQFVYLAEGYQLPDSHCVCCGSLAAKRFKRKVGYTPWGIWFSIINPILLLILYLCLHKERLLRYGLCEEHAREVSTDNTICYTSGGIILPLFFFAAVVESRDISVVLRVLAVVAVIAWIFYCNMPRPLKIVKFHNGYIKLSGVAEAFKQNIRL